MLFTQWSHCSRCCAGHFPNIFPWNPPKHLPKHRCHKLHFTDEKTGAQTIKAICSRSGLVYKRAKTQIQVCLRPKPILDSIKSKRNEERSRYREPFYVWEMWPAPTQKSQWGVRFDGQDPLPRIGSPMGNQACIVPRLLWDLFLLKIPHPELRLSLTS